MANKVSFLIQLKDQFGRTAKKFNQQFAGMKRSVDKTNQSMSTFSSRTKKSLAGIKSEAIAAAKAMGAMAAVVGIGRAGANFQDAIAGLSAITGAAGTQLRQFSIDARIMARDFGFAQVEVANAMTQVASSKSELLKIPGALTEVTSKSLLLAKAAGISIPDAVRASVGALNQFNVGADQAGRFINVIAAGSKVGASQVGETAEALKNAGGVASAFGLSFEETNAVLQVFAKNEVKGAEAGTKLRGTLIRMEKLGGKFAPSVVGMAEAVENLNNANFSNVELSEKFGAENIQTALILRNNLPLIRQWTKELTGSNVASEQANIRLATFNSSLAKAGTSISNVAIKIFNGLEPVLTLFVDLFTFIINLIDGTLSALGNFLGQTVGALSSLSFSAFDFGSISDSLTQAFGSEAPTAPVSAANGSVNGQIVVSATSGAVVESTSMTSKGAGLSIGMNMAGP